MLFSNPASVLMIVVLNSGSGILLVSVFISSLALTSLVLSFGINSCLSALCLGICVSGKPAMFPAPESNGYIMKKSHTALGLTLQKGFLVSAVCILHLFSLLLPSGQSPAEFLLACSGNIRALSTVWQVLT